MRFLDKMLKNCIGTIFFMDDHREIILILPHPENTNRRLDVKSVDSTFASIYSQSWPEIFFISHETTWKKSTFSFKSLQMDVKIERFLHKNLNRTPFNSKVNNSWTKYHNQEPNSGVIIAVRTTIHHNQNNFYCTH